MPRTLQDLWQLVVDELPPLPAEPPPAAPPALVLLNQVDRLLRRYVWFPTVHHSRALALWVLHTWAFDPASATPYMALISPENAVRQDARARGARADLPRAAARREHQCRRRLPGRREVDPHPADRRGGRLLHGPQRAGGALRGILNAGNRRGGYVVRGTQEGEPRRFAAFCPKALSGHQRQLAGHGRRPQHRAGDAAQEGRARMSRTSSPLRSRHDGATEDRPRQLGAGAADELAEWRRAERVPGLTDRLQEGWDPLLAIADHAGGRGVGSRARPRRNSRARPRTSPTNPTGHQLLAALAQMFEKEAALLSQDICNTLKRNEELPFGAMRRGDGMDPRMLASLLRPYNIRPQDVWVNRASKKGYNAEAFDDAWARYAPPGADEPRGDLADDETVREASARDFWPQERVLADLADIAQDRGGFPDACSHESHRETDWRLKMRDGNEYPWHCGTCHPPAFGLDIELRHAVQSKEKS
jgi:hypothetical protein